MLEPSNPHRESVPDELGLQGHFLPPPGPEDHPEREDQEREDPEREDQETISRRQRLWEGPRQLAWNLRQQGSTLQQAGVQVDPTCPSWVVVGPCAKGHHHYAKELICGREWCGYCGGDNGMAHQRRKASWLPKVTQLERIGYFVIRLPPDLWDRARDVRELARLGSRIRAMFSRRRFRRGLRRWHFF